MFKPCASALDHKLFAKWEGQGIYYHHIRNINDLMSRYPQQFEHFGNFAGNAKLRLKEDAELFMDASRKCSVHVKDKLKRELDSRVSERVMRKFR